MVASEGKLSISAGSSHAYYNALATVKSHLHATAALTVSAESLNTSFDQPARAEYIDDPSLFLPLWNGVWEVGTILSLDEKLAVLSDPETDILLTVSHRGEHDYYPECSVESIISAWRAGVDVVELDLRFTADGVAVNFHDGTLTRMTNYGEVRGKAVNGVQLPVSENVEDWTYEQLRQLNLKSGLGGNGAGLTDYKIATFEEILTVANRRILLYIDNKTQSDDLTDILYELMKKTGNFRSVLLGGSTLSVRQCVQFQKQIHQETGITPMIYTRANSAQAASVAQYLQTYTMGSNAILLNGEYYTANQSTISSAIRAVSNRANIGGWTLLEDPSCNATPEYWQEMYALGFRLIMTDNIFDLLDFAKTKNASESNPART